MKDLNNLHPLIQDILEPFILEGQIKIIDTVTDSMDKSHQECHRKMSQQRGHVYLVDLEKKS